MGDETLANAPNVGKLAGEQALISALNEASKR
jgi:hypothetical protein